MTTKLPIEAPSPVHPGKTAAEQARDAESLTLKDASLRDIYAEILTRIGEDPARDGLVNTPKRMERAMEFLTHGYHQTVEEVIHGALFDVDYDEMVIVKDIEFFSQCEHHLLPFFGRAHVAYVPQGKVIGLSKIPRIVDVFARRLQVQERLTAEVADCIWNGLKPQGVAVVIEATHACMTARGVRTPGVGMVTSRMMGVFREDERSRREVLALMDMQDRG
jgi:GTP cyclohydrolase I